ncbi:tyrosine-type recombinase/integrase [Sphingobium yanoikuyae]|uniref:Integrase n=1 Tax=Sphingobium yanoikuyae TaxID=13690 RepID=A0A3G2UZ67_SPHYA|nr:tyrosine-type recombinase/integrase [Sphingobium yanoikuyae]AYO80145.1 integrase [Sphingobium yanoikuyae]
MTKKRRRRYNRHLPQYVSPTTDRHGKVRLRYRRKGFATHYFKAELGTDEFLAELRLCEQGEVQPGSDRAAPGSIAALIETYVAVPSRLGPTEMTQRKIRGILDRVRTEYGKAYVRDVRFDHVEQILEKRLERRQVGTRWEGGPEAAKKLRKELVRLFDFAIKLNMISKNPAAEADRVKVKAGTFHTWTESEIAQYRAHHALGTKARLAMELMLWTAQRKGDAFMFAPADVEGGRFEMTQSKTGKAMRITMAPQLAAAIDAMPPLDGPGPYLRTSYNRAFKSAAAFGNWFRKQCNDAGLPARCSAHGLRKAMMRRGAEIGLTQQQLKSVSGHSRDEEVRVYTEAANQGVMNASAVAEISDWESRALVTSLVTFPPADEGKKG